MNPFDLSLPIIHLNPGDLYIAKKPTIISTILGSCVSICLLARFSGGVGAMCHCLFASAFKTREADQQQAFRYVDRATEYMLLKIKQISHEQIVSKILGGSDMLQVNHPLTSIGKQNIEAARRILQLYDIPIVGENVGGERGRKIFFNSATGEVLLKQISSNPLYQEAQL